MVLELRLLLELNGQPGQMFLARAAGIPFWTIFAVWVGTEVWLQRRRRLPAGALKRDQGSMTLLIATVWSGVGLGLSASWYLRGLSIGRGQVPLFAAGLVLMGSGLLLRWWAVSVLGPSFTVEVGTSPEQSLTSAGPYRWVRHPSYSGSLLTIVGISLCCGNWLALAALVLPFVGYGYRIQVEERALLARFGDSYRAYMGATTRLLPGLI